MYIIRLAYHTGHPLWRDISAHRIGWLTSWDVVVLVIGAPDANGFGVDLALLDESSDFFVNSADFRAHFILQPGQVLLRRARVWPGFR